MLALQWDWTCALLGQPDEMWVLQMTYMSRSAQDAHRGGSSVDYCDYLEQHAHESHDYFMRHGDPEMAMQMLTRTYSESLMGNDGD